MPSNPITYIAIIVLIIAYAFYKIDFKQKKVPYYVLEQKVFEASISGKIIELEKHHGAAGFKVDTDTSEYVIGFARNENYFPTDLYDYVNIGTKISKKKNTNSLLIDDKYYFNLFTTIEKIN